MGIGLNEDNNAMYKLTVHFLFPHSLDHRIEVGMVTSLITLMLLKANLANTK